MKNQAEKFFRRNDFKLENRLGSKNPPTSTTEARRRLRMLESELPKIEKFQEDAPDLNWRSLLYAMIRERDWLTNWFAQRAETP